VRLVGLSLPNLPHPPNLAPESPYLPCPPYLPYPPYLPSSLCLLPPAESRL